MCGRYNCTQYGEMDRHLKVRYGEHVEISPLTFKKTRPSKRVLFEIILWIALISHLLKSLLFWQTRIVNFFFKSKKAY